MANMGRFAFAQIFVVPQLRTAGWAALGRTVIQDEMLPRPHAILGCLFDEPIGLDPDAEMLAGACDPREGTVLPTSARSGLSPGTSLPSGSVPSAGSPSDSPLN